MVGFLQKFADACRHRGRSLAEGSEGRKSLLISNAAYLSSWERRMVDIPVIGSREERDFEENFERWLLQKGGRI